MRAGTSIRLASGRLIRSEPEFLHTVRGYGKCSAEEIRIGDYIRFGRRNERVVSNVTWRTLQRGADYHESNRYCQTH